MSFTKQEQILPRKVGLFNPSSPSAVIFKDEVSVFYNGGGNDGIWYTHLHYFFFSSWWESPTNARKAGASNVQVAKGTTPNPIVYNKVLYVFFVSAKDKSIQYITSKDRRKWTQPSTLPTSIFPWSYEEDAPTAEGEEPVSITSSPITTVHKGKLYLFYPNTHNEGIHYSIFDGKSWSPSADVSAKNLGLLTTTTPFPVSFKGTLYLFYSGRGGDGIWLTSLSDDGKWSDAASASKEIGDLAKRIVGSPAAFVTQDKKGKDVSLTVLWTNDEAVGIANTTDAKAWTGTASLRTIIGTQGLMDGTSPTGVNAPGGTPYIFWAGAGDAGLWFSKGQAAKGLDAVEEMGVGVGVQDPEKAALMGGDLEFVERKRGVRAAFTPERRAKALRILVYTIVIAMLLVVSSSVGTVFHCSGNMVRQ